MVSTTRSTGAAGTSTGPDAVTTTEPVAPRVSDGQHPGLGHRLDGGVEGGGAEEHHRLLLVGEHQLEVAGQQLEELAPGGAATQNGSETVRATAASWRWATSMASRMAALAVGCSHR